MIFAVMLSVSCNSDDDSGSDSSTNALVGTWRFTEIDEGTELKVTATVNANNSGTLVTATTFGGETETETDNFTWSTSGNKLTIVSSGVSEILTYSISGNKLTLTDQDNEVSIFTKL
jgi:hypothetical protein